MGELYNILTHSVGSIILGSVLTLLGVALLFFLLKGWYRNAMFTPMSYIVGFVLFFLMAYHAILICGAVTIKGYSNDIEIFINNFVADIPGSTHFTQQDTQDILEQINENVPIVGYYLGGADFSGHTPSSIALAMVDEMRSYMNKYILKHLLWCLLFICLGAFIVIKTMDMHEQGRRAALRGGRANSERSVARRTEGRASGRRNRRR